MQHASELCQKVEKLAMVVAYICLSCGGGSIHLGKGCLSMDVHQNQTQSPPCAGQNLVCSAQQDTSNEFASRRHAQQSCRLISTIQIGHAVLIERLTASHIVLITILNSKLL